MYKLPYGEEYLEFELPEFVNIELLKMDVKSDRTPQTIIKEAIEKPYGRGLPRRIDGDKNIAIAISDLTRPVPNKLLLSILLPELINRGAARDNIKIIAGTGMHRKHTEEDLRKLVGKRIFEEFKVISHEGNVLEKNKYIGTTSRGTPLYIDRNFVNADFRIVTGMIDPHQLAGFTGGLKAVTVGLGYKETIVTNHELMYRKNARAGKIKDNPFREDIDEVGDYIGIDFCVNLMLNDSNRVIRAVAGEAVEAWSRAIKFLRKKVIKKITEPADLVIASAGGYPKDINLYQAQKALGHAVNIVRERGTVILLAECREGSGSERFREMMASAATPAGVIANFDSGEFRLGSHKAYLFCRNIKDVNVILVTDNISASMSNIFKVNIVNDIEKAVTAALNNLDQRNKESRVAIIPKASSLIPKISG